jgi:hypothetical protein
MSSASQLMTVPILNRLEFPEVRLSQRSSLHPWSHAIIQAAIFQRHVCKLTRIASASSLISILRQIAR